MVTVGDHPNVISLIGACTRTGMNCQVIILSDYKKKLFQSRVITCFFVECLEEILITCLDLSSRSVEDLKL